MPHRMGAGASCYERTQTKDIVQEPCMLEHLEYEDSYLTRMLLCTRPQGRVLSGAHCTRTLQIDLAMGRSSSARGAQFGLYARFCLRQLYDPAGVLARLERPHSASSGPGGRRRSIARQVLARCGPTRTPCPDNILDWYSYGAEHS